MQILGLQLTEFHEAFFIDYFSKCDGYQLSCSDNCEEVVCAAPQLSKDEVMEAPSEFEDKKNCQRLMCPKPYYKTFECINVETSTQLCFCPKGYKQTLVSKHLSLNNSETIVVYGTLLDRQ